LKNAIGTTMKNWDK